MKLLPLSLVLSLGILAPISVSADTVREWKDESGRTIKAELLSYENSIARVRRDDGHEFQIHIDRFARPDQEYLKKLAFAGLRSASAENLLRLLLSKGAETSADISGLTREQLGPFISVTKSLQNLARRPTDAKITAAVSALKSSGEHSRIFNLFPVAKVSFRLLNDALGTEPANARDIPLDSRTPGRVMWYRYEWVRLATVGDEVIAIQIDEKVLGKVKQ